MVKSETYQRANKFIRFFEKRFECSGLCETGFFYLTRPITEGIPKQTCMMYLK
jgi:hypothetical protein